MNNKLNYSTINDAWGSGEPKKFAYQKPKENVMNINSNEIQVPNKQIKETFSDYIKPCSLVEEHLHRCEICKNKLKDHNHDESVMEKLDKTREHMTSNIMNISKEYLDYNDISEHFENISPSQKNLLVIILYGILIILISDLIIKEKDE